MHENDLSVSKHVDVLNEVIQVNMAMLRHFLAISIQISHLDEEDLSSEDKGEIRREESREDCVTSVHNFNSFDDRIGWNLLFMK
jgi:hypothetical protein